MPGLGDFAAGAMEQWRQGKANVAAQLQQDDPTTPASALDRLARAWANWRLHQEIDPMNPVGVGGLGGVLRQPGQLTGTAQALKSLRRIPVSEEAKSVPPTQVSTPGQPTPQALLPGGLYEAQRAEAQGAPMTRADVLAAAKEIRSTFKPPSRLKPEYEEGKFQDTWYTGAYPQLVTDVEELAKLAPKGLIDPKKDPILLAKNIASTSPQAEPGWNVDNALRAWVQFLKSGREPELQYQGFMRGYALNLQRALKGDPLSGQKVSNYLLDILGSEIDPTIDRWAANTILGKPSTKANLTDTEYKVSAQRMKELGAHWGTTPVRAQAALWTGGKLERDERMLNLLAQGLTKEQTIPALREVIAGKMQALRERVSFDPRIITPTVAIAALLLEHGGSPPPRRELKSLTGNPDMEYR
jgi:hypothetical protein